MEDCCGAIIDQAYGEIGEEFTIAFLTEFANNPTSLRFRPLLSHLKATLLAAKNRASKTVEQTDTLGQLAASLQ